MLEFLPVTGVLFPPVWWDLCISSRHWFWTLGWSYPLTSCHPAQGQDLSPATSTSPSTQLFLPELPCLSPLSSVPLITRSNRHQNHHKSANKNLTKRKMSIKEGVCHKITKVNFDTWNTIQGKGRIFPLKAHTVLFNLPC